MFSTGQQLNFNQAAVVLYGQRTNSQSRLFRSARRFGAGHHAVVGFVLDQPMAEWLKLLPQFLTGYDRKVLFLRQSISKLFRKPGRSFRSTGENDGPSNVRIESADDSKIHVARFVVSVGNIGFSQLDQARLARFCAHRWQRGRFVDNQQVVIFEQDVQIHRQFKVGIG